jgi:hypothetical protein
MPINDHKSIIASLFFIETAANICNLSTRACIMVLARMVVQGIYTPIFKKESHVARIQANKESIALNLVLLTDNYSSTSG